MSRTRSCDSENPLVMVNLEWEKEAQKHALRSATALTKKQIVSLRILARKISSISQQTSIPLRHLWALNCHYLLQRERQCLKDADIAVGSWACGDSDISA